jgi:hypothetical protein
MIFPPANHISGFSFLMILTHSTQESKLFLHAQLVDEEPVLARTAP